jgi:predicted HAD superfamily phosphohydrolase YqeG
MGKVCIGINLEFVRHDNKPFEWGVEKAGEQNGEKSHECSVVVVRK